MLPVLSPRPQRFRWVRTCSALIIAASTLVCTLLGAPAPAAADTLSTDVIYGQTAESRELAASEQPDISATQAIVMDDQGTVYFERDADEQVKIASITKIMTAIVALENADLSDTITVDHAAATIGESSAGLKEGDTMTLESALKALLIPSGNDAAMAIATCVGATIDPSSDDPYATFVQAMNDKAAELGLDAVFTNPHGLDFGDWEDDMHASARDVATMFRYAMQNDTFRSLDGADDNTITVTGADGTERQITLEVLNHILGQEGNIGGKTGTTPLAGTCFAGTFERDGDEVYVVVLGCADDDERFADTLALANWYYDHQQTIPLVSSPKSTGEGEPLVARATHTDWADKTVDIVAADPDATASYFDLGGELTLVVNVNELSGNVEPGDAAGTLTLYQGEAALASVDLVAAEEVRAPNPLEWLLIQFDRFTNIFTGEPNTAGPEILATVATK